uniref:YqgF/RNase H-like domain-containing protein n=1 Tax=Rhodosorus marinus TaxID=101924 RepID=A0A7S2ZDD4_9RHOD|mmetsp:Transcript_15485/g.63167  ORF Transcript_15485/g.63167 Transcript_15485/m.63167 type:complete len:221 (+) Transcript_15485:190-852(+)
MLNFLSAVCCIGGSDGKVHLGKKTLAVDYGLRRVGLALSVGIAPRRLNKIYNRGNLGEVARRISDVARREMVLQVVVGLPLNSKGDEGEQAAATRKFCEYLRIALPEPPIYLWDERFSTQTARNRLMSSKTYRNQVENFVDSEAAVAILEDFFENSGDDAELLYPGRGGLDYGKPQQVSDNGDGPRSFKAWKQGLIQMSDEGRNPRSQERKKKKRKRGKK